MKIGEFQSLKIARQTENGLYLTDGEDEVLLPNKQIPAQARIGDSVHVFLYTDSEDRPIATFTPPKATVGEFAMLRVVSITPAGSFFDWGLEKDLFCPRKEEQPVMKEGREYLVRVYFDERSNRVACSTRVSRFLAKEGWDLHLGQKVPIIVSEVTPEWIGVIVDGHVKGAIFADERVERLQVGDRREAYVKRVRGEDGRVAISLRPQGFGAVLGERAKLLNALKSAGGELPVHDKSSPEEIQHRFGLSKGAFKKLVGVLYKEGIIELKTGSIKLK